MSTYRTIKEHLSIKHINREYRYEPIDAVTEQVASLATMMILNQAAIHSVKLLADGKEYTFSGKEVTPELHALVRALSQAEEVDFVATVSFYEWSVTLGGADIGDVVSEAVKKLLEENPAEAENIFFSVYSEVECGAEGVGYLSAYGDKDGKHYNGIVDEVEAELPALGEWCSCSTPVVYDSEDLVGKDIEAIKQACRAFSVLTGDVFWEDKVEGILPERVTISRFNIIVPTDVDFSRNEEGITFSLNSVTLKTKADFEKYIALCAELLRVTDGECGILSEFVDNSLDDTRTLKIDINEDGSYTAKLASV